MKAFLQALPLQRKLFGITAVVTSVALLLIGALFFLYDAWGYQTTQRRNLSSFAEVVGANSAAALLFLDHEAAGETLASLRTKPEVVGAFLFDAAGVPFAEYVRPEGVSAAVRSDDPGSGYIVVDSEVRRDDERAGRLRLIVDRSPLRARMLASSLMLLGGLLASFLVTLLLSARTARLIADPIIELSKVASRVAAEKDYSLRAQDRGISDEVGALVRVFNTMLAYTEKRDAELAGHQEHLAERVRERTAQLSEANAKLLSEATVREQLHAQLMDASRQAGMAEVATSVLHNVGNVLNSVNVSVSLVAEKLTRSRVTGLDKGISLLDELAQGSAPKPEQSEKARHYLRVLARHLVDENADMRSEIASLENNVQHIKHVVSLQQSHATGALHSELVSLADCLDQALAINSSALELNHMEVVREYESVPEIWIDRHKLLQILVNLISNAKHALHGRHACRLLLRIEPVDTDPVRLRILVQDNGCGIAAENLGKVFAYGFTTRSTGHGFGLHSAALAAQDIEGELRAESDGPDKGARFTLELPTRPSRGTHASAD